MHITVFDTIKLYIIVRLISDIFIDRKVQNLSDMIITVHVDCEKAFDSVDWKNFMEHVFC